MQVTHARRLGRIRRLASKTSRALPLAAFALLALATTAAVQAQIGGSPAVGPTPRPGDERTAAERELYSPLGIRLGSFLLFPAIEADETLNDNIRRRVVHAWA
jgi:hypothetical protein